MYRFKFTLTMFLSGAMLGLFLMGCGRSNDQEIRWSLKVYGQNGATFVEAERFVIVFDDFELSSSFEDEILVYHPEGGDGAIEGVDNVAWGRGGSSGVSFSYWPPDQEALLTVNGIEIRIAKGGTEIVLLGQRFSIDPGERKTYRVTEGVVAER